MFFFCTHEQLTISLNYSKNRTYSCTLTALYINFRSDTYKLYPRYLLADVKCVKRRDKRACTAHKPQVDTYKLYSRYLLADLKLNTRLPTKKIRKLDVDAFREEGKRFKSQIHLIIINRDC